MRPEYETELDRANERDVAALIGNYWGVRMVKTPRRYPYDYLAIDYADNAQALIEVKARKNEAGRYPTYLISLAKIVDCQTAANVSGLVFYLVVGFTDKIMFWQFQDNEFFVNFGGRSDRGDNQDREPMAFIPMEHFEVLDVT